jgi:hypothetical protein
MGFRVLDERITHLFLDQQLTYTACVLRRVQDTGAIHIISLSRVSLDKPAFMTPKRRSCASYTDNPHGSSRCITYIYRLIPFVVTKTNHPLNYNSYCPTILTNPEEHRCGIPRLLSESF